MEKIKADDRLIPEWMEDYLEKIDIESMRKLHSYDMEYLQMEHERKDLEQSYPFLSNVIEDDSGAINLTEEQHKTLYEYIVLRGKMELRESQIYYMTGHKHCFEYLCKIGVIKSIS